MIVIVMVNECYCNCDCDCDIDCNWDCNCDCWCYCSCDCDYDFYCYFYYNFIIIVIVIVIRRRITFIPISYICQYNAVTASSVPSPEVMPFLCVIKDCRAGLDANNWSSGNPQHTWLACFETFFWSRSAMSKNVQNAQSTAKWFRQLLYFQLGQAICSIWLICHNSDSHAQFLDFYQNLNN